MTAPPLVVLGVASVALSLGLAAAVVVAKLARNIRETRIRGRRDALRDALERGGEGLAERLLVDALRGGPERIDDALWALGTADADDARRANLAIMAGRGRLAEALERIRGDRRAVVRSRAALITGRLAPADAVPRIAACLVDPATALAAVRALGMLATPAAAGALLGALSTVRTPDRVLDQLAHPWAADAVATALAHEADPALRPVLIEAAGLSGARDAVPDLERALAYGETEERVRAARALGRLGAGVEMLLAAMGDADWPVRGQAAAAIALIDDEGHSDAVIEALSEGLEDPAWWVRAHCANALGAGPRGRAALERARHGADRFARDRAEEAIVAGHLFS